MTNPGPMEILAALRLEDGRTWGGVAAGFQREDAGAVFDPNPPHMHFVTRPRGGAKTTDIGGVSVPLLVMAPPGSRCYAVAADADQAGLLVDVIRGFVLRTPGLSQHLRVEVAKVTSLRNGATLEILAADAPSAFGLRPYMVVCDELSVWPNTRNARGMWEAVLSAMPKMPGARLVVLTTAGDPAHWSYRILQAAKASPAWRVHEIPGPCPWIAPEALDEQRRLLTESQYARLHLNVWASAEDRLVRNEDLRACVVLSGPQDANSGTTYVIGVDVGLRRDATAICVAHGEDGGRVVLDRMVVLEGTRKQEVRLSDVEEAIVQAWEAYGRPTVRLDPWQAIGLRQRLEARGVRAEEFAFSPQSVGRLAATLHVLLRDRLLALPDDERLLEELGNVRLRETSPGVVRMDHDPDRRDDQAVALAMCAEWIVNRPQVDVPIASPGGYRARQGSPYSEPDWDLRRSNITGAMRR